MYHIDFETHQFQCAFCPFIFTNLYLFFYSLHLFDRSRRTAIHQSFSISFSLVKQILNHNFIKACCLFVCLLFFSFFFFQQAQKTDLGLKSETEYLLGCMDIGPCATVCSISMSLVLTHEKAAHFCLRTNKLSDRMKM